MKSLKKGFTLVELMVVIVIIGILAALAIPRFLGATNKTKASEFKPVLKQIYTLQTAYFQEKGSYSNNASLIGFDPPVASASRFTYSADTIQTRLGKAQYNGTSAAGRIMGVNGTEIATSSMACIDTAAVIFANAADLANLTNAVVNATKCQ